MQSSIVEEWKDEARVETRIEVWRKAVLDALDERFVRPVSEVAAAVRGTDDAAKLRAWNRMMAAVPTLAEFRAKAGL